jgi:hypothetical protein
LLPRGKESDRREYWSFLIRIGKKRVEITRTPDDADDFNVIVEALAKEDHIIAVGKLP